MVVFADDQAAVEYVGTTLKDLPAAVATGARDAKEFLADHPLYAILIGLGLILLLYLVFGRRRA